jgi:hypothetical protein
MGVKMVCLARGDSLSADPVEKFYVELLFELLDMLAYGGLGKVKLLGSARETPVAVDRGKNMKVMYVQKTAALPLDFPYYKLLEVLYDRKNRKGYAYQGHDPQDDLVPEPYGVHLACIHPVKGYRKKAEGNRVEDKPVFRKPCPESDAAQAETGQDDVDVSEYDGYYRGT